jgi:signal transduction histidine kinase
LPDGLVIKQGDGLVGRAASLKTIQTSEGTSWRAAIPLQSGETLHGVMDISVNEQMRDVDRVRSLGQALANQIAIGIQNATLHKQQLELAAQEERNRIARDIHDGVAQSMYALSLSLETSADLAERDRNPLREQLRKLVPLAKNTLLETRHYIYDLKPLLSGETDLRAVAENQVREFQVVAGVPTELSIKGSPHRVNVAAATGLYRILQESLANVLKHSHASKVEIELSFNERSIQMTVRDNGVGFDEDGLHLGYGLDNIRHRVKELGGSVEIQSAPGNGTTISVTLPVKEVESEAH